MGEFVGTGVWVGVWVGVGEIVGVGESVGVWLGKGVCVGVGVAHAGCAVAWKNAPGLVTGPLAKTYQVPSPKYGNGPPPGLYEKSMVMPGGTGGIVTVWPFAFTTPAPVMVQTVPNLSVIQPLPRYAAEQFALPAVGVGVGV